MNIMRMDGNSEQALNDDVEVASKLCVEELGAVDVFLVDTEERKKSVWPIRGAFLEAIKSRESLIKSRIMR
ncbi:MAG: hypothetical protein PHV74_11335 [Dehalococcoidia bacterium]|nr:hypothetical protein [Dehalococcoidia bacterium]